MSRTRDHRAPLAHRRRRTSALALAAALLCATVCAAASAQSSEVAATWDVLGVGPNGRSLELVYITGGCLSATADTAVTETVTTVTITVQLANQQSPGVACPDFLRYATTSVSLAAPLAGRVILGRPSTPLRGYAGGLVNAGGRLQVQLPRLVGFARADARHTLALYGLREQALAGPRRHGLVRVSAQMPKAGALVPQRATVTLRITRPAG